MGKKVVGYLPSLAVAIRKLLLSGVVLLFLEELLILLCVIALLLTVGRKENQKPRSDYS